MDFNLVNRNWRQPSSSAGGFREPPAAPEAQPTRSFGFQSGAGPAEKLAAARAPELAGAGTALGEPTSFRGGAGAPMPVEVVRGGRTTYTNPAPDAPGGGYNPTPARNTQEFASPIQAQQAWNRGMASQATADADARGFTDPNIAGKYGEYREPGQTGKEIMATKEGPGATQERTLKGQWFQQQIDAGVKKAQTEEEAKNVTNFTKQWHNEYSPRDKAGKMTEPTDPNILQDRDQAAEVARTQGTDAGHKHYQQSLLIRQLEPLFTPENMTALQGTPGNQNNPDLSPAALDFIKKNPQAKREYMLKYGPMLQQLRPPQPPQSIGQRLWEGEPGVTAFQQ